MRAVVRISVEIPGAQDSYPSRLEFTHVAGVIGMSNPNYYGHEVQVALGEACEKAKQGVQPYVVNRP